MSTKTADSAATDAVDEHAEHSERAETEASHSNFWPDETVDAICALVVITTLTLGVLFYVMNG